MLLQTTEEDQPRLDVWLNPNGNFDGSVVDGSFFHGNFIHGSLFHVNCFDGNSDRRNGLSSEQTVWTVLLFFFFGEHVSKVNVRLS